MFHRFSYGCFEYSYLIIEYGWIHNKLLFLVSRKRSTWSCLIRCIYLCDRNSCTVHSVYRHKYRWCPPVQIGRVQLARLTATKHTGISHLETSLVRRTAGFIPQSCIKPTANTVSRLSGPSRRAEVVDTVRRHKNDCDERITPARRRHPPDACRPWSRHRRPKDVSSLGLIFYL